MGCDIHLYFEKRNELGIWEEIKFDEKLIPNDRDYWLFSFLADVRNYRDPKILPQFPNRGFPNDSSIPENDTKDFWIGDHSFTYAYLDEILNLNWEEVELNTCYFYIFCKYIIPRLNKFCGFLSNEENKNIRVIMGFDN